MTHARTLAAALLLVIPDSGIALAQWKADRAEEAREYIGLCPANTGMNSAGAICEGEQRQFLREYPLAYFGDYQAQRNVGYCLERGSCGVWKNRIQGCAWRLVLITSGNPRIDGLDVADLKTACSSLSEGERQAAAQRAAAITDDIQAAKGRQ